MPLRHLSRRATTPALIAAVLAALLIGAGAPASATPPADTPPTQPPVTVDGIRSTTDGSPEAGRYIVVLRDEAAATYTGGVAGFDRVDLTGRSGARAKKVADYRNYLEDRQGEVADAAGVDALARYTLATNGFAADLTAAQAAALTADPRVSRIVPNEILHVTDAHTSTGYLGLEGDNGVWAEAGGTDAAGLGVVVGVIDTGIAPENPSFAGTALGSQDGKDPYRDGDAIVFHKADGSDFRGTCQSGEQFGADDCSTKIIGARYFSAGFTGPIGGADVGEYRSPRDGVSHGSHTASTAAGNASVDADGRAVISGVAPASKIAAYKVCWSGPDPASPFDDGCGTADLLSAIDAAIADGVDVINYSIGGGAAKTTNSLVDQAFFRAAAAGIFVSAAAGNAGPQASTLDNASPWITTVAASTIPASEGTVRLGDGTAALGTSVSVPEGGVTGPFVFAGDASAPGAESPELCGPGTLDPALVTGAVILCDRGIVDRVGKSAEVARAGGIGMVLVNISPDSTDADAHSVPTVHVDAADSDRLHLYAMDPAAMATLVPGNPTHLPSPPTPQIAGFSSRGPVQADGSDIIKPDLAAPGVNIFAATANAEGAAPTWGHMSGTSMAAPHVAGLAALYLGLHPKASPSEIKSTLMTTARETLDADGAPLGDPFAQGNGEVVPSRYLHPGLVYLTGVDDWNAYLAGIGELQSTTVKPIDGSDLNLASIGIGGLAGTQTVTRTVTALAAGTYTASVEGLPGVSTEVSPTRLVFGAAGETQTFTVTFRRTTAELRSFTAGVLTWADGDTKVRSALAVSPAALQAPAEVAASGASGGVDIPVRIGEPGTYPLALTGLAPGARSTDEISVGGSRRFALNVPEGARFLRVDLDAHDDSGDLSLALYRQSSTGAFMPMTDSDAATADERIDSAFPLSGTYLIEVGASSTGKNKTAAFDLTTFVVSPTAATGGFISTPTSVAGKTGDTATARASWAGLTGGRYLGLVDYGDTGERSVVTVDAGPDSVTPGVPTFSVAPTAVGVGGDLRVTAHGVAPDEEFVVRIDGVGEIRRGTSDSRGNVDWYAAIPAEAADGPHTATLSGKGVSLDADVLIVPATLTGLFGFPTIDFDGNSRARSVLAFRGRGGDVHLIIRAADDPGTVYLDEIRPLGEDDALINRSLNSAIVTVQPGKLVATAAVVLSSGAEGPTLESEPFEAPAGEPSSLTFTPTADDPSIVAVHSRIRETIDVVAGIRYYGHDGRQVIAYEELHIGDTELQWNLHGFDRLEVVGLYTDEVVARYTNEDKAGAADTAGISIAQDYWGTLTAPEHPDDAERPVSLEVSFRYPALARGFDIVVGEGSLLSMPVIYQENVPTEVVPVRGPVAGRTLALKQGTQAWTSTEYEIRRPEMLVHGKIFLALPAVTVADLRPGADPGTPGGPGTGTPGAGAPGSSSGGGHGGTLAGTGADAPILVTVVAVLLLATGLLMAWRRRARRQS